MYDIEQSERDMAREATHHEPDHSSALVGRTDPTLDRERTMRMLQRIADVLGRPVEDFFKTNTGGVASDIKADAGETK